MNKKGFTLIELIICIIIGGIFIPFTYVVFTSVVKNSMKPETAVILWTIAETKMNDINNMSYDSIASSGYTNVTSDPRFSDSQFPSPPLPASPIPNPYSGHQWRWEVDYVAYKDEPNPPTCTGSHCKTTISDYSVLSWVSDVPRKVGDYATPTDYPTVPEHRSFYRVYYSLWSPNKRYNINDMVRPTVANDYYYKSVPPPERENAYRYRFGDLVRPKVSPNGHYYKSIEHDPWVALAQYSAGDLVTVVTSSLAKRTYRLSTCKCSGFFYCRASPTPPSLA